VKVTTETGNVVNLFPSMYEALDNSWRMVWLSTRDGPPHAFETPVASLAQYPVGVTVQGVLPDGYSYRIAPTPVAGTYIGVWVQGPDGAQDIYYRVFAR
jgi:hypothetical protein